MFTQQLESKFSPAQNYTLPQIKRTNIEDALQYYKINKPRYTSSSDGLKLLRDFYKKLDKTNSNPLNIDQLCELLKILCWKSKPSAKPTLTDDAFEMLKNKFNINTTKIIWSGMADTAKGNRITPDYLKTLYGIPEKAKIKTPITLEIKQTVPPVDHANSLESKSTSPTSKNAPINEVFEFLNRDEILAWTSLDKKRNLSYFDKSTAWKELTQKRHPEEYKSILDFYPENKETKDAAMSSPFYNNSNLFWRIAYSVLSTSGRINEYFLHGGSRHAGDEAKFKDKLFMILIVANDLYGIKKGEFNAHDLSVSVGSESVQYWARKLNRQEILDHLYKSSPDASYSYSHLDVTCHQPVELIMKNNMDSWLGDLLTVAVNASHSELVKHLIRNCKPRAGQVTVCPPELLNNAVTMGDVSVVKCLVEEGHADPLLAYDDKGTPLEAAAYTGNLPMVKYFVEEAKIDLQKPDKSLLVCHENRDEGIVNEYRKVPEGCGYSMLIAAAKAGHLSVVKYLMEVGKVPVEPKNMLTSTALNTVLESEQYSSKQDQLEMVKYLVAKGAKINSIHGFMNIWTPLHVAAFKQLLDVIKFLVLEAHADVNAVDPYHHKTPLETAQDSSWNKDDLPAINAFLTPLTTKNRYSAFEMEQEQKRQALENEQNASDSDNEKELVITHDAKRNGLKT